MVSSIFTATLTNVFSNYQSNNALVKKQIEEHSFFLDNLKERLPYFHSMNMSNQSEVLKHLNGLEEQVRSKEVFEYGVSNLMGSANKHSDDILLQSDRKVVDKMKQDGWVRFNLSTKDTQSAASQIATLLHVTKNCYEDKINIEDAYNLFMSEHDEYKIIHRDTINDKNRFLNSTYDCQNKLEVEKNENKREIRECNRMNKDLASSLSKCNAEESKLTSSISTLNKNLFDVERKNIELQNNYKTLELRLNKSSSENSMLGNLLKEKDDEVDKLKATLEKTQKELNEKKNCVLW